MLLTPRRAIGLYFILQGFCFASWGARIPAIQAQLGLSELRLAELLFAIPVGSVLVTPLAGIWVERLGSHRVVPFAACIYAACLIGVGFAPEPLTLALVLSLFGAAGNLANIAVNSQAIEVQRRLGRSIIASCHGLWSLAGFFGAAVGSLAIYAGVAPRWHFCGAALLAALCARAAANSLVRDVGDKPQANGQLLWPDRALFRLGCVAFCAMICEGAMFDWSGIYFERAVQAPSHLAGMGYVAFMAAMASGRFLVDRLVLSLSWLEIVQAGGALVAGGLACSVLFPNFLACSFGFACVGAGVSSVVPLVYAQAAHARPNRSSQALSIVSTVGFMGFLLGPPIIGLLASAASLRASFTFTALMGIGISAAAAWSARTQPADRAPEDQAFDDALVIPPPLL